MTDIERIERFERIVSDLVASVRKEIPEPSTIDKENELFAQYGESVDKTCAANIIGVTRATIYAMLMDGCLESCFSGRKVTTRSIARYMCAPSAKGCATGRSFRFKGKGD